MEEIEDIAQRFKAARKELGYTQDKMGEVLGLESKKKQIYMIEKGKAPPSGILIKCLEYYLDLTRLKNLLNKKQ